MDVHFAAYNYFRGPIDAWTLCQNIGGPAHPGSTPLQTCRCAYDMTVAIPDYKRSYMLTHAISRMLTFTAGSVEFPPDSFYGSPNFE